MRIHLIIAMYQGNYDGIELATPDGNEAILKRRELVRAALELCTGHSYAGRSWEDVEAEYGNILENEPYPKLEEFHLDFVEVE